jgi:4-carboxymuconolactone decarboxylase
MRLPPLPDEEWTDQTRAALATLLPRKMRNARDAGNALATFVRHPDLAEAFVAFNTYLLFRSTLPARLRELAILRVARRHGCEYEWLHHQKAAAEIGLSEAEIEAAGRGEATDPADAAVLAAVDELHDHSTMSDGTWAELSEHLDERQRMDLVFTVGTYTLLAMAFNTFGVQPEGEDFGVPLNR